jgi:hypothetical protein
MTADDFSKVATPLAWPMTTMLIVWVFQKPVFAILKRLAESLTFKNVKVTVFGIVMELTPERARTVLDELLDDITESTNQLTEQEKQLFDSVLAADGKRTIGELIPGFIRDGEAGDHQRLRNLRDQKLIYPQERGQWKTDKHPVVTRYGQLVAKLRTTHADKVRSIHEQNAG